MNNAIYFLLPVIGVSLLVLTGCVSRRQALRPTLGNKGNPPPTVAPADAWYIESVPAAGEKPISCSFVEFDERGDYLDFQQHRHAYSKIKELATKQGPVLVLIYVHGWKNNSQSGNVVEFNNFLHQVALSPLVKENNFRVHGVYLAWRGNAFPHQLDAKSKSFASTTEVFGGKPIVNLRYARKAPFGWLFWVPEQLSYWRRKGAAEEKVSGVSLIRTIFTCGHTARRYSQTNAPNRVFLMGHSFGALMLEKSFAPASLARLTAEWPWDDEELIRGAKVNPLPFDLVLLVNSAAPSIYAKQYYGYMVAHREALANDHVVGADAPLVISLTSIADWATRVTHPYGNVLAPLYPSLWRRYDGRDFILDMNSNAPPLTIPQWYYYRKTPGHNPLLVNHWIVPAKESPEPASGRTLLQQNMDLRRIKEIATRTFSTSPRRQGDKPAVWNITTLSPDAKWSTYRGYKPLCVGSRAVRSGYWIIRCQKEIIRGHDDIWSQQAMETYAALFREAEFFRTQKPGQWR